MEATLYSTCEVAMSFYNKHSLR